MGPEFVIKAYGPPGTGKTRWLLTQLEDELKLGVDPREVAFVTFGHDALRQAKARALSVVNEMSQGADDLPLFRTFHSMAWRLLGLRDFNRLTIHPAHRIAFCAHNRLGYDPAYESNLRGASPDDDLDDRMPFGNYVIRVDEWLTNNLLQPTDWHRAPFHFDGPATDTEHYVERWRDCKRTWGRMDYWDVLELCRATRPPWPARVAMFDEFQDLSPMQYALYEQWRDASERVYIAGDDDQTIYVFQGATSSLLNRTRCTGDPVLLGVTHRMGRELRGFADLIVRRVKDRQAKPVETCSCPDCARRRGDGDGSRRLVVLERPSLDDVLRWVDPLSTFILARTNALAKRFRGLLHRAGVPYHGMRGPDDPGAVWSRGLILAKMFYDLQRDSSKRLDHAACVEILRHLDVYRPASGLGYVDAARRDEFAALPFSWRSWPRSPLGEDVSAWSFGMLRPYLRRVPPVGELADAFGAPRGRAVLDSHISAGPSWPITPSAGITVGTIHSSKGLEARTVVLLSDMSRRGLARMYEAPADYDSEHRVFYVGATRAVRRVVVASPMFSDSAFPLPVGGVA